MLVSTTLLKLSCAITFCLGTGRTLDSQTESRGSAQTTETQESALEANLVSIPETTVRGPVEDTDTACRGCVMLEEPELRESRGIWLSRLFIGERVFSDAIDGALWRNWHRPLP